MRSFAHLNAKHFICMRKFLYAYGKFMRKLPQSPSDILFIVKFITLKKLYYIKIRYAGIITNE